MRQQSFSRRSDHNGFARYERAEYLLVGRVLAISAADVLKVWTDSGVRELRILNVSAAELRKRQSWRGRLALWLRLFLRKSVFQVVGKDAQGRTLARLWSDRQVGNGVSAGAQDGTDNKPLCLDCGCEMLLRQVKSGANMGTLVWGCSGFPLCEAVRTID